MRPKFLVLAVVVAALSIFGYFVLSRGVGRSALHADYEIEKGDIGISGISKMYDARLRNRSLLPVHVQVCSFVTDANAPGTQVAFSVQKWDPRKEAWATVADSTGAGSCRPYPLGWAGAYLKAEWLWPGQSVSMGEEATAALGFHKGDSARFVSFSGYIGAGEKLPIAFSTDAFRIGEEMIPQEQALRIRH